MPGRQNDSAPKDVLTFGIIAVGIQLIKTTESFIVKAPVQVMR